MLWFCLVSVSFSLVLWFACVLVLSIVTKVILNPLVFSVLGSKLYMNYVVVFFLRFVIKDYYSSVNYYSHVTTYSTLKIMQHLQSHLNISSGF